MKPIRIIVAGASGRMGQTIIKKIISNKSFKLIGATEGPGNKFLGSDVSKVIKSKKIGIYITDDIESLFAKADAIIDFTLSKVTLRHAELASKNKIVHVIGTTGFSQRDEKKIILAAKKTTIIKSGNMSMGINILQQVINKAASLFDETFEIEVLETHHKHKIDVPSGTALMLGQSIASGKKKKLDQIKIVSKTGSRKKTQNGKITFNSFRKGNVVGDHKAIFSSKDEVIELSHEALDRGIFATGAIQAAKWGIDKKAGLYSMIDVLEK